MSAENQNNGQNQSDNAGSGGKSESDEGRDIPNASRRRFLKLGLAGAGAVAVVGGGVTAIKRMEGIPHDEFPLPVCDDFKRIDQRNQINTFALSKALNEKHPERNRSFNEQLKKENSQGSKPFHFYETRSKFQRGPYRYAPGYTQLERALAWGGFYSARQQLGLGTVSESVSWCENLGKAEPGDHKLTIIHKGNDITIMENVVQRPYKGVINPKHPRKVHVGGSYVEDGGYISELVDIVFEKDSAGQGESVWRWSDGYYECGGRFKFALKRIRR